MRGKIMFLGGLAAGFVLGARAGREKYEELVVRGRKVLDHPTVQEAAGVAQAQANRLYSEGKDKLSQSKLGEKLGTNGSDGGKHDLTEADKPFAGTPASVGAKSGGTGSTGSTSSAGATPSTAARPKPSGTGTSGSSV
jgi:ABC-type Na+ efflux pump permease subunit